VSGIAYPYLRLSAAAVNAAPWCDASTGDPLPDLLAHWDCSRSMRIIRAISVNTETAARDLQINEAELSLVAVVLLASGGAGGQRDRRLAARAALAPAARIEIELEGSLLSQALSLSTDIVLARAPALASPLSPTAPGLRLWSDRSVVQIEPPGRRFPIEAVDFQTLFTGHVGDAPFHADFGEDLGHDFDGAVRLYVNTRQADFVQRVEQADALTLQMMMSQVMTGVLRRALENEDFEGLAAQPGSIAAVASAWIEAGFPGHPLDAVRAMARHSPQLFETAVSALAAATVAHDE
jgi:hypothetical protein